MNDTATFSTDAPLDLQLQSNRSRHCGLSRFRAYCETPHPYVDGGDRPNSKLHTMQNMLGNMHIVKQFWKVRHFVSNSETYKGIMCIGNKMCFEEDFQRTTQRYIPKHRTLLYQSCENLNW
jgi:hypothetical protein